MHGCDHPKWHQTVDPPLPELFPYPLEDDAHDSDVNEDEKESKIEEEAIDEELTTKQPNKGHKKHGEKASNAKDATPTQISMPRPSPSFPQRLKKKAEDGKFLKFISMLKKLSMNLPLIEEREQILGYTKFMKHLVTKKRMVTFKLAYNLHHKEDPSIFTIPCTIGMFNFAKPLCDLGASINLMPLAVFP
ncbi:uncharacterized protein LOC129869781 [Solanum dulcamara]|uniref:uncharacterized protein LOC129869781 n=1 Tax=Solanum dulcamara TaxID=45834 RepID=UPI0024859A77|nr:uncharacterized protein LOC129869781 [Solanum dulcamara]